MPRLSVWFVRCALAYLALGFTIGALMLIEKGVPVYPPLLRLLPAHIEFVLFGWTVQLAMGIAFWILPRFGGASQQAGDMPPRGQWPSPFGVVPKLWDGLPPQGRIPTGRAEGPASPPPAALGHKGIVVGTRGNEKAAWLAFGLLNAGIWLAGMGPVLDSAPILPLLGRASEAMAAVAFMVHAWPRIKPMRS